MAVLKRERAGCSEHLLQDSKSIFAQYYSGHLDGVNTFPDRNAPIPHGVNTFPDQRTRLELLQESDIVHANEGIFALFWPLRVDPLTGTLSLTRTSILINEEDMGRPSCLT
jgi:hypothetical protein